MTNKKIIFMGTPSIAAQHLNILIENNFNIVGVFTQPPRKKNRGMLAQQSEVHKVAIKNNLNLLHPTSINDDIIEKYAPNVVEGVTKLSKWAKNL